MKFRRKICLCIRWYIISMLRNFEKFGMLWGDILCLIIMKFVMRKIIICMNNFYGDWFYIVIDFVKWKFLYIELSLFFF